jgi:hypothetical protein
LTRSGFWPPHGGLVATFVVFIADVTIGLHLLMENFVATFVVFIADVTIGLASSRGLVETFRRLRGSIDRSSRLNSARVPTAWSYMDTLKAA